MALTREQTSALGSSSGASLVWEAFYDLSQIPRMSKDERRALAFIQSLAEKHSLRYASDTAGNLAVFRPGTGTGQGCDPVIVQAHIDMVCEKNGEVDVRPTLVSEVSDPILLRNSATPPRLRSSDRRQNLQDVAWAGCGANITTWNHTCTADVAGCNMHTGNCKVGLTDIIAGAA